MLPLGTAWATARKSRIFGGFLRFLTRSRKEPRRFFTASASGAITGNHGQPVDGSLPAADAICPPDRGCRFDDHGRRITGRYVWGMGRGAGLGLFNSFNAATQASERA